MSIGETIPLNHYGRMEPNTELMHALQTLLEIGKYSDLTIICGHKKYEVHKAIICSRSGFFDGAVSSKFREAQTGVIDLSEDDEEAVEHMVNYFYKLDYLSTAKTPILESLPTSPLLTNNPNPFAAPRRPKKLNLAFVEDPLLATAAANVMGSSSAPQPPTDPTSPTLITSPTSPFMTDFGPAKLPPLLTPVDELHDPSAAWELHSLKSPIDSADQETPYLVTHAKVYAIAEKYGITGLKVLARRKFAGQLHHHLASEELPAALQEVYESTVDSDRGLRDVVIQAFRSHPDIARRVDVQEVIKDLPGLAWELFKVGWGLPITD